LSRLARDHLKLVGEPIEVGVQPSISSRPECQALCKFLPERELMSPFSGRSPRFSYSVALPRQH
jgi:hypothetical protein